MTLLLRLTTNTPPTLVHSESHPTLTPPPTLPGILENLPPGILENLTPGILGPKGHKKGEPTGTPTGTRGLTNSNLYAIVRVSSLATGVRVPSPIGS